MIKYTEIKVIDDCDFDELVQQTYGKHYILQQQEGGMDRQYLNITVPPPYISDDSMNDNIPEVINGDKMGVKFATWLARDPKQPFKNGNDSDYLDLFWERNFYPDLNTVLKDLYEKGLIEAGEYTINIDW